MDSEPTIPGLTIAVVGATGAVGREMLKIVGERSWTGEVRALASERSAGTMVPFRGDALCVQTLTQESFAGVDIALFSAGGSISREFGPIAAQAGAFVIDNSSAFRMESDVPLVIPEVNAHHLALATPEQGGRRIIANPNCSTVQLVVALQPLHADAGLTRIVVSTYQSVSGAGMTGIQELLQGTRTRLAGRPDPAPETFAHPIAFNALPHIAGFLDNGFTTEEMKMVHETRKIMSLPDLQVAVTCVRIPVLRGHSESVLAEFERPLSAPDARRLLSEAPGVVVIDQPERAQYPLARDAESKDDVFVGRIREDLDHPSTLHLWIVSDNLRKGAATNAVQIVDQLIKANIITPEAI